ncbi:unnamed protein product [Caenorhabditis sp. 36 PRJEB53466]|nr:unnamed protein product [Caenorhabditis sp. 36 PRJEB53466]
MRVWRAVRFPHTARLPPAASVQAPPVRSDEISSKIFDPDDWPLWKTARESIATSSETHTSSPSSSSSTADVVDDENPENSPKEKKKNRTEVVEENRSDGHAPIKTACSVLMQALQKSSSRTTSLSDIDVTLFNFHSQKFAERLLARNVSSVVIVESSV